MADLNSARSIIYHSVNRRIISPYEDGTLITLWEDKSALGYSSEIYSLDPNFYHGGGPRIVFYLYNNSGPITAGTVTVETSHDASFLGQWTRSTNFTVTSGGAGVVTKNSTNKIRVVVPYTRVVITNAFVGGSVSVYMAVSGGR